MSYLPNITKAAEAWLSPSLSASVSSPCFELKFLLAEDDADGLLRWAARQLDADPHGEPRLDGAYQTTSLYFDTPELDVYRRAPWFRQHKLRLRRYGASAALFAEKKSKSGDRVVKHRTPLDERDLAGIAASSDPAGGASWFQHELATRGLVPTCQVAYFRRAFVGATAEGPLRLTLDRDVRGRRTRAWSFGPAEGGRAVLPGKIILELKFRAFLPAAFKALVADLRLAPTSVSKYRACLDACDASGPEDAGV